MTKEEDSALLMEDPRGGVYGGQVDTSPLPSEFLPLRISLEKPMNMNPRQDGQGRPSPCCYRGKGIGHHLGAGPPGRKELNEPGLCERMGALPGAQVARMGALPVAQVANQFQRQTQPLEACKLTMGRDVREQLIQRRVQRLGENTLQNHIFKKNFF